MSSDHAMTVLGGVEFILTTILGLLFWKKGLHRKFRAMGTYLGLRVFSAPILFVLMTGSLRTHSASWYISYFLFSWAVYISSAGLIFFICMEVFRTALAGLSGLMRFGLVIFRWAVVVSLIVTFANTSFAHRGMMILPDIGLGLMRSISILELCLLAFLVLSMNALQIPMRSMAFGIAFGFGLISADEFIASSLFSHNAAMTAPLQFVYEAVVLLAFGLWIAYAFLPQVERKPIVVPVNSPIYRWNEIATALGYTGTQVAVQQPTNGFFLTDVENVVERVLARNLKKNESKT
jgi:hypothetical protein